MTEVSRKKRTNKLRIQMIIGFAALIMVMLVLIITIFNVRMGSAMKQQTSDMINHLNAQINSNVDGYMLSISDNVGKVCADPELTSFYPKSVDDSDETLVKKLSNYELLPFYKDFAIIYSNGAYLGRISEEMKSEFTQDELFEAISDKVKINAAGNWTNRIVKDHSLIFYVKYISTDSVMAVSVEADNMAANFKESIFIDGMNVYLVDSSLVIQCSTDSSIGPGSYLRTHIYRLVDRAESTQIGSLYVVATNKLSNGWFTVTAVPSGRVLQPLRSSIAYVVIIAILVAALGIGYTILMSSKFVKTVEQTVERLDVKAQTDLLTGLLNKRSFEEIVQSTLDNPEKDKSYALVFMDVDNFKGVNDRCGHDIGDEVLRSFAHTVGSVFREGDIKGRLGGDEFCVLMKMPMGEPEQMLEDVNEVCRRFRDSLHRKANSARQSLPAVTSSMGAAMWDGIPEDFAHLYHKADIAVYASKKSGKDTWSVYGQGNVNESIVE